MKIYSLLTLENGITCIYSDNNKLDCLDFKDRYWKYMDDGVPFENWEALHIYTNSFINKRKKTYDVLHHNVLFVIVNEKSKALIEKKFSDCIQFLEVINDDDLSNKYYLLNPFGSIDGLDIDRSKCNFMPSSRIPGIIYKYEFKNDVEYFPIFKLKYEGAVYNMRMYVTDEFKDFIEANGITGLDFEEVFDFSG